MLTEPATVNPHDRHLLCSCHKEANARLIVTFSLYYSWLLMMAANVEVCDVIRWFFALILSSVVLDMFYKTERTSSASSVFENSVLCHVHVEKTVVNSMLFIIVCDPMLRCTSTSRRLNCFVFVNESSLLTIAASICCPPDLHYVHIVMNSYGFRRCCDVFDYCTFVSDRAS